MESPHDIKRLRYITSDLIYMVLKSKISIECNDKEFDCWNFRTDCFSNFNVQCVFLVGDYHIRSFTNVQRKSVGLEPVINSYQFRVHRGMNIVNVTVSSKNCCIVLKRSTFLNWLCVFDNMPVLCVSVTCLCYVSSGNMSVVCAFREHAGHM